MAGGSQVLTEVDDDRAGGGQVVDTSIPPGISTDRGTGQRQQQARQPEEEFEVILEDTDGQGGETGEGRITTTEVGERTALEQQQRRAQGGEVKIYSREEIDAMSPDQRRRVWRGMSRDEQRVNRPLDRARRKDNAHLGKRENEELRSIVAQQAQQIEQLSTRVNGFVPKFGEFEKGQMQARLQNVNTQLTDIERAMGEGRRRMATAMGEQDHETVSRIIEEQGTAFIKRAQLQNAKQLLEQQLNAAPAATSTDGGQTTERRAADQQPRRQEQQRQKSPEELSYVREFRDEFPQFNNDDPDDEESQLVVFLDARVAKEGYNPATEQYWDRLRDLMQQRLPEWFDEPATKTRQNGNGARQANGQQQRQANGQQQMRRGPATGAGGEATGGQNGQRTQVKLNKQRVDALILANVLDRDGKTVIDKPKFKRMLAKYTEFDREQAGVLTV